MRRKVVIEISTSDDDGRLCGDGCRALLPPWCVAFSSHNGAQWRALRVTKNGHLRCRPCREAEVARKLNKRGG